MFSMFGSQHYGYHRRVSSSCRVLASHTGDRGSVLGRVIPKTLKMVHAASCLALSIKGSECGSKHMELPVDQPPAVTFTVPVQPCGPRLLKRRWAPHPYVMWRGRRRNPDSRETYLLTWMKSRRH